MLHIKILIPQIIHDLWLHKLRSSLAIFCIAFGIFAVLMLSALGKGFYDANNADMVGLADDAFIVWQNKSSMSSRGYSKGKVRWITINDVLELPRIFSDIIWVSPIVSQSAVLSYKGRAYSKSVTGVSSDYIGLDKIKLTPGSRFINQFDMDNAANVAVITWRMKEILFGNDQAIGVKVLINNIPFTVIGVLSKDSSKNHMFSGDLLISYKSYMSLYNEHQAYFFMLQTNPDIKPEQFKLMLRSYFAEKCHFDKSDDQALGFWASSDMSDFIKWFFIGVQMFLWFCGLMILAVGSIGVANIMFLIVTEKTYEIGLRKAVGATDRQILFQIFLNYLSITG